MHITLLLYFGTRAHHFSPDEGSCNVFSNRNNSYEFLTSYDSKNYSIILKNASFLCIIAIDMTPRSSEENTNTYEFVFTSVILVLDPNYKNSGI